MMMRTNDKKAVFQCKQMCVQASKSSPIYEREGGFIRWQNHKIRGHQVKTRAFLVINRQIGVFQWQRTKKEGVFFIAHGAWPIIKSPRAPRAPSTVSFRKLCLYIFFIQFNKRQNFHVIKTINHKRIQKDESNLSAPSTLTKLALE